MTPRSYLVCRSFVVRYLATGLYAIPPPCISPSQRTNHETELLDHVSDCSQSRISRSLSALQPGGGSREKRSEAARGKYHPNVGSIPALLHRHDDNHQLTQREAGRGVHRSGRG